MGIFGCLMFRSIRNTYKTRLLVILETPGEMEGRD